MNFHYCALIIVSFGPLASVLAMPQNRIGPNNPVGGFRPITNNDNRRGEGRRPTQASRNLSPAYPPPELYLAPQFDEFGAPLPDVEDYIDDYEDDIFEEVIDIPKPRPRLQRPPNTNLGPDLQPRLPNFDILRATEVLRTRDQNQNQIVSPGEVNAGILPLAFENPAGLGLFPPLAKP